MGGGVIIEKSYAATRWRLYRYSNFFQNPMDLECPVDPDHKRRWTSGWQALVNICFYHPKTLKKISTFIYSRQKIFTSKLRFEKHKRWIVIPYINFKLSWSRRSQPIRQTIACTAILDRFISKLSNILTVMPTLSVVCISVLCLTILELNRRVTFIVRIKCKLATFYQNETIHTSIHRCSCLFGQYRRQFSRSSS